MTIEGGRDAHSEHSKFSSAAHRKNWKDIALFLAAGFAIVAIKELLLSGVPHLPTLVK